MYPKKVVELFSASILGWKTEGRVGSGQVCTPFAFVKEKTLLPSVVVPRVSDEM